jgi:hypothetical protein
VIVGDEYPAIVEDADAAHVEVDIGNGEHAIERGGIAGPRAGGARCHRKQQESEDSKSKSHA